MFKSSLEDGAKDNKNLYTTFSSFALKLLTRKKKTDSVRKGFGLTRAAANIECNIKLNKDLKIESRKNVSDDNFQNNVSKAKSKISNIFNELKSQFKGKGNLFDKKVFETELKKASKELQADFKEALNLLDLNYNDLEFSETDKKIFFKRNNSEFILVGTN